MLQSDFLVFDIETDGLLDTVSKVHCVGYQWPSKEEPLLEVGGANMIDLLGSFRICGHNIIGYDLPALHKCDYKVNPELVYDTLILSQMCYPKDYLIGRDMGFRRKNGEDSLPARLIGSHSLEAWGYRLKILKGDFGKQTDWSEYTEEMGEYCKQDVRVSVALLKHFQTRFPDLPEKAIKLEHDFAQLMFEQEQNGWQFDRDKALDLYSDLVKSRTQLQEEAAKLHGGWYKTMKKPEYYDCVGYKAETKGAAVALAYADKVDTKSALSKLAVAGPPAKKHIAFNPGSRDHIVKALQEKYNWEPSVYTKAGKPQMDEKVLKGLPFPEAKKLSELFDVSKMIGMLAEGDKAWLKLFNEETNRIYGRVNTLGTRTRRCSHQNPNLAQVPAHSEVGSRCRELFTVPPGCKLVGCDAQGLELRMLAHYMSEYDGGAYAQEVLNGDIHSKNQEAAGLPTRDNAKTFIYGFIYGAGDGKIGEIVGGSAREGRRLKNKFLKSLPALKKLMEKTKRMAAEGNNFIISLDGCPIYSPSRHSDLNTLLQSAGAILMKKAACIFKDRLQGIQDSHGVKLVGNIHDEFQCEVPMTETKVTEYSMTSPTKIISRPLPDVVGQAMANSIAEAGRYYNLNIPMEGSYQIGDSWKETH